MAGKRSALRPIHPPGKKQLATKMVSQSDHVLIFFSSFLPFFFFTIEFSQPSMAIDISGRMDHGANSLEIIGFSVSQELCAECARRARYARH